MPAAFKALGIELKTGATRTEALAAVQKVATGQAEDYAGPLSCEQAAWRARELKPAGTPVRK